jgi:hypothetical protein
MRAAKAVRGMDPPPAAVTSETAGLRGAVRIPALPLDLLKQPERRIFSLAREVIIRMILITSNQRRLQDLLLVQDLRKVLKFITSLTPIH